MALGIKLYKHRIILNQKYFKIINKNINFNKKLFYNKNEIIFLNYGKSNIFLDKILINLI